MKIINRIAANSIVANVYNSDRIGLFDGKMGIALSLFEYARLTNSPNYHKIAEHLLHDVISSISVDTPRDVVGGLSGIGIGLSKLLREHIIDYSDYRLTFELLDRLLVKEVEISCVMENNNPLQVYSSGLYMASMAYPAKPEQIRLIIAYMMQLIGKNLSDIKYRDSASMLISLIYTIEMIYQERERENKVVELEKDIANHLAEVIENRILKGYEYRIVGNKTFMGFLNNVLRDEVYKRTEKSILNHNKATFNTFDLWWPIVYNKLYCYYNITGFDVEKALNDGTFNLSSMNSTLSAMLLNDMSN